VCWSPTADLVAGTVVTAIGVAALANARQLRQVPLAALPLLLGAHQLIEAVVWLGQQGRVAPDRAALARTLWAVIAFPLLPALVPLAVLLVVAPARRPLMLAFAAVGLATSAALALDVASGPVTAQVAGHSLRYGVAVPAALPVTVGYLLATVGALCASGQRDIRVLGLVCGAAALVCAILWQAAFVSTWCGLAAVSSLLVLRWAWRLRRGSDLQP
jgi:hypothetical protein